MKALREKWVGKNINKILDQLGTPDHVVQHPNEEKQYIYRFSEKQVHINIFRGEELDDMSTIRVQEEIARAEQSKCMLDFYVKNDLIIQMDSSGQGCQEIKSRLWK